MAFDLAKTLRSHRVAGGVALALLAVLFIGLVILANYGLRGVRADLTKNSLYTLSPGTRSILARLDEPVNLYFYFSRDASKDAPRIRVYANRVREMLEEMSARARGQIHLEVIDPQPYSEDEDRAGEFGLTALPMGPAADNLYFGLAGTNSTDGRAVIPFFQEENEQFLEYDVAKLLVELSRPKKPVIGLLTSLPMNMDYNPMTGQMRDPWVVATQLEQLFTVRTLTPDLASIDKDIDVLMLVHPKNLQPGTLYAIDQFVLRGGRALIFVDPQAEADPAGRQQDNPMAAMGADRSSTLEPLLKTWGVDYNQRTVVGDLKRGLMVGMGQGEPTRHIAWLGLDKESMSKKDVITAALESINVATAGSFKLHQGSALTLEPLLETSDQAGPIPVERFAMLMDPATLRDGFQPTGERYVIAARLSGKVKSAFPNGKPSTAQPAGTPPPGADAPPLAESARPVNLVLVADADMLSDNLWVRNQSFFGQRVAQAFANNGDFVFNAVDNLTGNDDLISIRGRASFVRPFERVEDLRREAEARFRAKEQELEGELRNTEQKLSDLQARRNDQSSLILTPEQEKELDRFQEEKVRIRKELRDVRHSLNEDIDSLGTRLKVINILLVPILLSIFALLAVIWRRRRGAAQS